MDATVPDRPDTPPQSSVPTQTNLHSNTNEVPINLMNAITEPGITIVSDSNSVLLTTFSPANPIIVEDLKQVVTVVKDTADDESIVDQIKLCAAEIKCEDFHGNI